MKQTNRAAAESVPANPIVETKKDLNGKPLKSNKSKLIPILFDNSRLYVRLNNIQYSYLAEFSVPIFLNSCNLRFNVFNVNWAVVGLLVPKMSNLIISELNGSKLRKTEDGRFSVYDLIRIAGGKKNPRQCWNDLCERHLEVVRKTDSYTFPGKGQQLTPVVTKENCFYILGLLPGICGQTYREKAANIVRRYIEGDAELGAEMIARDTNKARVDRAQKRILMTETNKQVAEIASATGIKHSQLHNDRYNGLYRKSARELRVMADLPASDSPLSRMSARDLTMNSLANQLAIEAGDGAEVFDFANDIRESYQKRMGKRLEPKFEENILRPQAARNFLEPRPLAHTQLALIN